MLSVVPPVTVVKFVAEVIANVRMTGESVVVTVVFDVTVVGKKKIQKRLNHTKCIVGTWIMLKYPNLT